MELPQIEGLRLTMFLAEGAWGEVYAGERLSDGLSVAVKMLHARLTHDDVAFRRMIQEGQLCWSLDHPNVIRVLDWGRSTQGRVYLVMERLHGGTLDAVLRKRGPLPASAVIEVARGIASGLKAIHRRAIHRDIKPSNVFLRNERPERAFVKILDLGIASLPQDDPDRMVHTQVGEITGTPAYLAPERFRDGVSDTRVDVYALGATLFECLTGDPPYKGTPLSVAVQACRARTAPALPAMEIPDGLRLLISRMLDPDPNARPASCDEILGVLDRVDETLELERWSASTGVSSVKGRATMGFGGGFLAVAMSTVHQHYHPEHVPEAISARVKAIERVAEALTEARGRCEATQAAAAELACRLDRHVRDLALAYGRRSQAQAAAEAALDASRQQRQAVGDAIRELDRAYVGGCAEFDRVFLRATLAAAERGEPIDPGGAAGIEAAAVLAALDNRSRERARLVAEEAALTLRIEGERTEAASRARAAFDVRETLSAVEVERVCSLSLLEREARDAEEAAERLAHDQSMAHLELGVTLQRQVFD